MVNATVKATFSGSKRALEVFMKEVSAIKTSVKMDFSSLSLSNTQDSTCKSKTSSHGNKLSLMEFKSKYALSMSKYSSRSVLLKTHKKVDEADKVFKSDELDKPLYYQERLKGWITSLDNEKYFSKTKVSLAKTKHNSLEDLINKYDLQIVHDDDQLYDTVSSRVLYLQSVTDKNPKNKSDYVFKHPELKYGLFFKEDFEVWQTTVANKTVLEKYTKTMENSDDDDYSYNDELSEMSSTASEEFDDTLSHLTFENYGKGLLMRPKKSDAHYGQKYFYGGYWNKTLGGWVFSKSKKSTLEDMGACYSS